MGDVILALPALRAVRERFPDARLTAMVGKTSAMIARISGVFDELIIVDRVELRDGKKRHSLAAIRRIVRDVRARKFDFVIDLHSLSETNLLGFLSGAKSRLYAHRENRSLDVFAKFSPPPPREDKSKHVTDRYLDVLKPLGIESAPRFVEIVPPPADVECVRDCLRELGIENEPLVGAFPGAGHPSRRWPLENFAELAERVASEYDDARTLVVLGPEEVDIIDDARRLFGKNGIILDKLNVPQLLALASILDALVSNDTGVAHLGAVSGANLVLVIDERAPSCFLPLAEKLEIVRTGTIEAITVDDVFNAAKKFLTN